MQHGLLERSEAEEVAAELGKLKPATKWVSVYICLWVCVCEVSTSMCVYVCVGVSFVYVGMCFSMLALRSCACLCPCVLMNAMGK